LCLVFFTTDTAVAQDAVKPYPIYTADHLDATMQTLGPNVAGVRAALAADDFATAKARVIRSREQLATTVTFWRDNERDDALSFLRAALERMDALDVALSTDAVDATGVDTLVTEIGERCAACHEVYREQDRAGAYQLKQSALR
jgi:hypothetical protein